MKITTILTSGLLISGSLFAQIEHFETIDGNAVAANIGDIGRFFHQPNTALPGYEVPAGDSTFTIYTSSICAGATDMGGQLFMTYTGWNAGSWSSGPIADPMEYGSVAYSSSYGKSIWKVTRQQAVDHVQQFQQTGYTMDPAIAEWPGNGDVSLGVAQNLAPFVDMDGDGLYEPMDGDYPDFPGSQVVYVILNDESYQPNNPMGVELHLMFYQFVDGNYLNETTFLNTRTYNRSTRDYFDYKQAFFVDFDIGNPFDDFIGCDSVRNVMYAYNGDQLDETSGPSEGYGTNPPCQGLMSLNRPMTACVLYANGSSFPMTDPNSPTSMWNLMNGTWVDGSPVYYGGNGYNNGTSTNVTTHIYTGNPYTGAGWSEVTANNGNPNPPNDRRGVMTTSLGDLPSGTMVCADYAFIYNDSDGHLENVQNVLNIADALQNLYNGSNVFPCWNFTAGLPENTGLEFNLYPNPSSGEVNIQFETSSDGAIIQIHDVTGRLVFETATDASFYTLQLLEKSGLYAVTVKSPKGTARKMLVLE